MQLIPRFFKETTKSFFLFGPRGTGKTTLIKSLYQDAVRIDLLKPEVLRKYLAFPEQLREIVIDTKTTKKFVLDEIQRAPSLLAVVHELIEEKKDYQFILTGSSARKLRRSSADLLGGRALKRELFPFMASELGDSFSLQNALQYGLLPLVWNELDPQDILNAYVNLYLQEEIQAEGLVRNIENFARFLQIISFSHGSLLNVSNIARTCETKRKTVENYINIIEDLLLAFQLTVFTKRAQRDLSAHPKFYLFDSGVFKILRPKGPFDRPEEIEGAALEGLVAQHLRAWNEHNKTKNDLHFWRTRSGVEIDFVIYGPNGIWGIEVKNAKIIRSEDLKSLESFMEDYPMAKTILLYRGTDIIQKRNTLCIPCEIFLKKLKPNAPIWEY